MVKVGSEGGGGRRAGLTLGADFPLRAATSLVMMAGVLALAWAGTGQMVFAGLSSAVVLLGCAGAGYHWLEHHELDD